MCDCIKWMDDALAAKNMNTACLVNLLDPNKAIVATYKIRNYRDGKSAAVVFANYCPFCGEKYVYKQDELGAVAANG